MCAMSSVSQSGNVIAEGEEEHRYCMMAGNQFGWLVPLCFNKSQISRKTAICTVICSAITAIMIKQHQVWNRTVCLSLEELR
jgi:hypothetical protein